MTIKLLENESIDINDERSIGNLRASDDEINGKYRKGDVRIITEQARYPLNTILSIVESDDYILNPEFQRRHRWNNHRKSKLIESIIMNVPIPPIFLYEISYSVYEVMDGLQRLTAISQFYKDGFELEGLFEWAELNGKRYSNLPEQVRKGIDRRYLSAIILLQETAKDEEEAKRLKQLVFERINSGGAKLTYQESRNAIYPGAMNDLCISLARDKNFCLMWGIPFTTKNEIENGELEEVLIHNPLFQVMEDVELVLRFFAFRQIEKWDNSQLRTFFDSYLKKANLYHASVIEGLRTKFIKTTELLAEMFAEKAFWLPRERKGKEGDKSWVVYESPTKVLYDSLMSVASEFLDQKEVLIKKKGEIDSDLFVLYQTHPEKFKGRFNKNDITSRIELVKGVFDKHTQQ